MFWKRYYESFPVRMKIIANNVTIIYCHLVKVAIFAVTNFFSLFRIDVFNIPITHIIMFLLFLMQSYCFFRYFQIFFNFFHCLRVDLSIKTNFVFMLFLCSSLFRRRSVSGGVCPDNHTQAHTHAHIRTRTRIFR